MIPYSNEYLLQYMATLDTSNYSQGLKGMQNQTEGTTNKIDSAFGKMTKSINAATIAKGAMAAAAIYVANKLRVTTKEVMAYQKQLGMVNTLLKVSRDELNKYGDEFERLSLKTGTAKTEIADAAYQALSSGVGKGDLIGFLETASKTAIAGQATVEQSVGTITSIINAYKMEMSEAGKVADWLLTIQNEGVTTVRELGDQLGDVTSISAALGVSLNDVGGAIAQMTVNGNNTAKTITMLKSMLSELSKEGQTAADNFKKLSGQSFTEFIANGGTLQEAMIKMEEYAKKSNKSVVDLFSSVEAGSAALNLTGINAENFANKLEKVASSSGELETAYKTATTNIYYEWQKLTLAIDKQWNTLVETIITDDRMVNFIKRLRTSLDGENNNDDLEVYKNDLKEIEESLSKINKQKANLEYAKNSDPLGYMQNIAPLIESENQLKEEKRIIEEKIKTIEGEVKAREEAAKKVEETNQKVADSENKKNTQLQDLRAQEENRLEEHNDTLKSNELKYLQDKKDYIAGQQNLLSLGIINQEEYNRNIKNKENELYLEQQKANLESLKQMEDYYRNIDDLTKANEFKKKVIEVELNIQQRFSTERNDVGEDSMLDAQLQARKEQQASLLENEWLFLQEQVDLYNQGKLSVEDIEKNKNIRLLELEQQRLEQEALQLEQRKAFYESNTGFEQELADTIVDINENKIKQEENAFKLEQANKNKKFNWEKWASNYEVDIYERSAGAIMDTYTALAQGQIKSLEDFKKFAMLQLAELMLSLGQENAAKAISKTAEAIGYATNPATASLAPPAFASAAKFAAVAAAFGVASSVITNSVNSEEGTDTEDNNSSSTQYDEGIEDRVESSKEESEGTVYINVENSNLMKLFINDIEKELKDGYNVTLIGKKKG